MGDHSFLSIESKDFHNLIHLLRKDVSIPSIKKEIINTFNNSIKEIRKVLQVCKLFLFFLLLNIKFL